MLSKVFWGFEMVLGASPHGSLRSIHCRTSPFMLLLVLCCGDLCLPNDYARIPPRCAWACLAGPGPAICFFLLFWGWLGLPPDPVI